MFIEKVTLQKNQNNYITDTVKNITNNNNAGLIIYTHKQ